LGKRFFIATPFTSLVVLESPADYATFKLVKGRKDPFAFYVAPSVVPVRFEPAVAGPTTARDLARSVAPAAQRGATARALDSAWLAARDSAPAPLAVRAPALPFGQAAPEEAALAAEPLPDTETASLRQAPLAADPST